MQPEQTAPVDAPVVVVAAEHVDTDAAGVVHFSRYASLLETGALEHLHRLGAGLTELAAEGLDLAVTELRLRYHAPARHRDRIAVHAAVATVTGASCEVVGSLRREADGALLAEGRLLLVAVTAEAGTATPLPRPLRRRLAAA